MQQGNLIEENHYYVYGLKIASISSVKLGDGAEGGLKNNYLYNDKELVDDGDLNWYDYGFRSYDAQIGRFPQLDPLTDKYSELTPYQYASNDPITNIDIDGLEGGISVGSNIGSAIGHVTLVAGEEITRAFASGMLTVAKSAVTVAAKAAKPLLTVLSKVSIALHSAGIAANVINNHTVNQVGSEALKKPLATKNILTNLSSLQNSTDNTRYSMPNKAGAPVGKLKSGGGLQMVVYGSGGGGTDIGSRYNPNKKTLYLDFPKFMEMIELGNSAWDAVGAKETLKEGATTDRWLDISKKTYDQHVESMGDSKEIKKSPYIKAGPYYKKGTIIYHRDGGYKVRALGDGTAETVDQSLPADDTVPKVKSWGFQHPY